MMKAMISQPMRGKTGKQIRSERQEAVKFLEARGYEAVNTVFPDFEPAGSAPLKYLAKSIEAIADVDLVYFINGWKTARGCRIERQCCEDYGIPFITEGRG
jgi:hypothetical protein